MITLDIVQQQYERMPDAELQLFARNEAHRLTIQSFHLLKAEFEKRNLDLSIINEVAIDNTIDSIQQQRIHQQNKADEIAESWWQYALDEKEQGATNYTIYNALIEKGADAKYAFTIVQNLELHAKALLNDMENDILYRWLFLIVGIVISGAALVGSLSMVFILFGIGTAVGSWIKLIDSSEKKQKLLMVLKQIAEQNAPDEIIEV